MKKIIKLTESDLEKIIGKVLYEQGNMYGTAGTDMSGYRKDDSRNKATTQKVVTPRVETINPKNLKVGARGEDVKKMQSELIKLGFLKLSKGPTGYFGPITQKALDKYYDSKGEKKPGALTKTSKDKGQLPKSDEKNKLSSQVSRQIDYMKKSNILSKDKFTILDDKKNQVHAFNPGYQLYKTYYVITGKDKGDALKTKSMLDWVKENFSTVGKKFFSDFSKSLGQAWNQMLKGDFSFKGVTNPFDSIADYIDSCYFGQEEWLLKNTPSGVFKRAGTIENFMNDWLATTFIAEDYGDRFITWETCNGKTIPYGFHGTKSSARLKVLEDPNIQKQNCKRRQMSFGCINFNDNDVQDINKFITSGQLSIWLPDATDDIVEIPSSCTSSLKMF